MRAEPVRFMRKSEASAITGGLTQTSKMPCKSYSLPTIACRTGFAMRNVKGSICSHCYAQKGFYAAYASTIEPAQHARLVALEDPAWIDGMVALIGGDPFFRWHDSGDLQGIWHLDLIAQVARRTPHCRHWLPTREYQLVAKWIRAGNTVPDNLVIRLSAMFPDQPVAVPAELSNVPGIATSNVHTVAPTGQDCAASKQGGACRDCRACWDRNKTISYLMH